MLDDTAPLPLHARSYVNVALLGCGGGCGRTVAIHWPSPVDPHLDLFRRELHKRGWFLGIATTEVAGEKFHATVCLCQRCGSPVLAPPKGF